MAAQMTPRFRDLPDVDWASFADGEVPTYDLGTGTLTGETPAAGGSTGAAGGVLSGTYPDPGFAADMATQAELDAHSNDSSFVHGITNTADLATDAEVAAAIATHSADETSVHGIADTSALVTDADVAGLATDAEVAAALAQVLDDDGYVFTQKNTEPADGDIANGEVVWWFDDVLGYPVFKGKDSSGTPIQISLADVPTKDWFGGKGELFVAQDLSGSIYLSTLAPGADGEVLTATSSDNKGLSWEAPAASTPADASTTVKGITKLSTAPASPTSPIAAGDNDTRLSDTRTPTDGSVTAAKVNTALKPSGTAATTDESLRRLGTSASHAAAGDDSRFPTTGQKNALAGTAGTPGTGNEYATKATTDALLTSAAAAAAYQPLDSDLTAIAALTTTSAGRALLDDADASAQLTTLGVSTFVKTLLDDTDAATAIATLGAVATTDSRLVGLGSPNTQTGDYTLVLTDAGKSVEMNAATTKTLTVPLNSSVAFVTGTVIEIARLGAGAVNVAATGGVTVRSRSSLLGIGSQYSAVSLRKRDTDEWVLVGDLV